MREVVNELEGFTKYNIRSWAHHDQLQIAEVINEHNDLYTVQQSSEYRLKCEDTLFDNY